MDPSQSTESQGYFGQASDDDYSVTDDHYDESAPRTDEKVEEEEFGTADQAIALELFDLINHQDIWNISALQSDVYAFIDLKPPEFV